MPITLSLETMTVSDKMQVMENIWLSFRQNPAEVESPAWHGDVLAARKKRVSGGMARYDGWEKAKRRIRTTVKS